MLLLSGCLQATINKSFKKQMVPDSVQVIQSIKDVRGSVGCAVACYEVNECYGYTVESNRCNLLGCVNIHSNITTKMAYYRHTQSDSKLLARGLYLFIVSAVHFAPDLRGLNNHS